MRASKIEKKIFYTIKNELRIDDASLLLASSNLIDLNKNEYPEIQAIEKSVEDSKRESLGSVNLRADEN